MKNILIIILAIPLFIWSCDKIDNPIPENLGNNISISGDTLSAGDTLSNGDTLQTGDTLNPNTEYISDQSLNISNGSALRDFIFTREWDTAVAPINANQQFVLLEEFTGHLCINCIPGTKEILRLDSIYKEKLIPVGIHAGTFARFSEGASKYSTNFNPTPQADGEAYLSTFNPEGANPRGVVNRLRQSSGNAKPKDSWATDVMNFTANTTPKAQLELTNYYDSTSKIIRADITVTWQESLSESYSLQIWVLEDKIIDWQKDAVDPRRDIPDYEHRHVLRKVVNGTFGKTLETAVIGESEKIQYIFPFTENLRPNAKNFEVVVFIFDNDQSSYEVIQANAAHVVSE